MIDTSKSTRLAAVAVAALACAVVACEPPDELDGDTDDGETDGDAEDDVDFRIVDPTPVPPTELLGMVMIDAYQGSCSGMLIARDTVLTAAHCFCTTHTVGGNVCLPDAVVTFRDNPAQGGFFQPERAGTAVVHSDYNPSWTDNQAENDLAVVTLASDAPTYVPAFRVATSPMPTGASAKVAGFGKVGSGCGGSFGTLNSDQVTIDAYEDGGKIMRFNDPVVCKGDSGGAVLNVAGTVIYGVHSTRNWTFSHGWVSKAISVPPYHAWVEDHTCSSSFWDVCDGKGPICQCGEGGADCDDDDDCEASLICEQNVGALFGFTASADVCVEPGPIQGACGCGPSGLGNICIASYNNCAPGFSAVCSPASGACGSCSCQ